MRVSPFASKCHATCFQPGEDSTPKVPGGLEEPTRGSPVGSYCAAPSETANPSSASGGSARDQPVGAVEVPAEREGEPLGRPDRAVGLDAQEDLRLGQGVALRVRERSRRERGADCRDDQ